MTNESFPSHFTSLARDAFDSAAYIDDDFDRNTTPEIELLFRITFDLLRLATHELNDAIARTNHISNQIPDDPYFDYYYSDSTTDEISNPAFNIDLLSSALYAFSERLDISSLTTTLLNDEIIDNLFGIISDAEYDDAIIDELPDLFAIHSRLITKLPPRIDSK